MDCPRSDRQVNRGRRAAGESTSIPEDSVTPPDFRHSHRICTDMPARINRLPALFRLGSIEEAWVLATLPPGMGNLHGDEATVSPKVPRPLGLASGLE